MVAFLNHQRNLKATIPSLSRKRILNRCCDVNVIILSWVEGNPVLKQEFQENLSTAIPLSSIQMSESAIAAVSVRTAVSYSPDSLLIEMKTGKKKSGAKAKEIKRTSWVGD